MKLVLEIELDCLPEEIKTEEDSLAIVNAFMEHVPSSITIPSIENESIGVTLMQVHFFGKPKKEEQNTTDSI